MVFPMLPGAWQQFKDESAAIVGIEISDSMRDFCDYMTPVEMQGKFFDACLSKQGGGILNHTLCHGDFRLENLFFKEPGSDEKSVVFIDFQLLIKTTPAQDPIYFLMNSVPVEWRRENELELLNCYYDTLIASPKVDGSVYTWNCFLLDAQTGLCGCICASARTLSHRPLSCQCVELT